MIEFFLDYFRFLKRHWKWVVFPLLALVAVIAVLFLINGEDMPMYFLYAIF